MAEAIEQKTSDPVNEALAAGNFREFLEKSNARDAGKEVKTEAESSPATVEEPPAVTETKDSEQEKKPSRREQRILELLNENKRLASELEKTKRSEPKEAPVEKKEAKVEAAAKPLVKDFATYEDWVEALSDWKANERIAATEKAREAATKTSEVEKANKEIEKIWMERVDESKKLHEDYEAIAFNKDLPIKAGSVVDRWILESDKGPEILYFLGSNPEELDRINGLHQIGQARELAKIEGSLEKAPAAKVKVTKAPPPPADINGNGTITKDPAEDALEKGNFRKYMDEMNAKELRARKGK